ncbi:hypothetical protein RDI58_014891 [Solanum bulbocastanum]|uniref:Uncharacterized protein n=1 Tax=Solanum bulbocastanum TaxID=147425 RepID=A0AAN8TM90_SOLBU
MKAHPLSLNPNIGRIHYVVVEEKEGFFHFVAKIELEGAENGQVRAQAVEIHPGVMKIFVRKGNRDGDEDEQFKVDTWRYRLPASTMLGWPWRYLWTESL